MAVTQTYCDYATGNDYIGATFTDGAFTVADMTLTKTGAFTASKLNHWLYLDDNGSGEVTPGYYKIASVTSANAVVLATSPKSGANDPTDVVCTQAAGTALLPYRSVQGAFDLTTRDATNGDQINVKAGTAQVLAASLTLATYGTPTPGQPLILRGCTATANDGGRGAIDGAGAHTIWAAATYDWIACIDMDFSNAGNNHLFWLDEWCLLLNCRFDRGASTPVSKNLCIVEAHSQVIGCSFTNAGTSGGALLVQNTSASSLVWGNYATARISVGGGPVIGNIINLSAAGSDGMFLSGQPGYVLGNIVYQALAGTGTGINLGAQLNTICMNNIVVGFSGTGGKGVAKTGDATAIGYNAFYNNTANYSLTADLYKDFSANDVALGADPFTDAANGDFSLTETAKTALRSLGWPPSYLGAHANSDPHITIGAMQYGPAVSSGGGGPVIGSRIIRGLGAV